MPELEDGSIKSRLAKVEANQKLIVKALKAAHEELLSENGVELLPEGTELCGEKF